jgi:4-alpha-glucanotransferase
MEACRPDVSQLFHQRRAGVLLHPTSLPSQTNVGTLGADAYRFVDFLAESGLTIWQMLPIGPTHSDRSPYQSLSAHAGSAELISLEWLVELGWINTVDFTEPNDEAVNNALRVAAHHFFNSVMIENNLEWQKKYHHFYETNAYWLDDFALFQTLRGIYKALPWNQWPDEFVKREAGALQKLRAEYSDEINNTYFEQFVFNQQWLALRNYARRKEVYLFGDMPIFVAHDSADVWANQEFFNIDAAGNPLTVAGVPPDYFSETGQHWGNPHYDWQAMQADGFQWWLARLRSQLQLFDLIRIDHFRGFEAFWEIPGEDQDARNGRWIKAPGREFLRACFDAFPDLPLVAENLGLITEEVEALRREFNLPGMLVLQFGFDGNAQNPHLPHHHTAVDVIYTGTHDNDTTLGWYSELDHKSRKYIAEYFGGATDEMPWLLIKAALASVSKMTIVPMQDWLALDGNHRMNMPGTTSHNWSWRFNWRQVPTGLAGHIKHLIRLYDRAKPDDHL